MAAIAFLSAAYACRLKLSGLASGSTARRRSCSPWLGAAGRRTMERLEVIVVYIIPGDGARTSVLRPQIVSFPSNKACQHRQKPGPQRASIVTSEGVPDADHQVFASNLLRIGLSTNKASATTTKFMIAVTTNTMCQLPVESLMMLASGTRNADAPF